MVKPFFLVVTDGDHHRFTVEGPMSDDTRWVDAVVREQGKQKAINCHSTSGTSVDAVAATYANANPTMQRTPAGSIVHP